MSATEIDYQSEEIKTRREAAEEELKGKGRWSNLPEGLCKLCDDETYPVAHFGSRNCKSFGMGAPDGSRSHCTCDSCF